MPADARSRGVFGDQRVGDTLDRCGRECRGPCPRRLEEVGDRLRVPEGFIPEVVLPPEGDDPPLSRVSAELEVAERQGADALQQVRFLRAGEQLRLVPETLWKADAGAEHVELIRHGHSRDGRLSSVAAK